MTRAESARTRELAVLALLAVAALYVAGLGALRGPLALSDDDYARLVIALDPARAARLDPSGTSWLPAPFWLYGLVLRHAGSTSRAPIDVARLVPFGLACAGTWLVYAGGRAAGLTRGPAALGALAGLGVPSVAQLAGLCVPEHPSAALCVFALLAQADRDGRLGAWASLAVCIASLSRYEAWPVAAVVACWALTRGGRRGRALFEAALALAGIVFWLVHNQHAHGSALHFLTRVADYRAAAGLSGERLTVLRGYGHALFAESPALTVALGATAFVPRGQLGPRSAAPWLGVLAMLVFLLVGALVGGVPTHHAGRAISAFFLLGGVYAAKRPSLALMLVVSQLAILPWTIGHSDGFSRRAEEELGRAARGLAQPGERLLVSTPDYGYFAVLAAFGDPAHGEADQARDPRWPDAPSRLAGPTALATLRAQGVRYVVAPALPLGRELLRRGKLGLYAL